MLRRVLILVACVAPAVLLAALDPGLLHLAPALALALPLLRGRYVGEERIAALAAARLVPRLPRPSSSCGSGLARASRATASRGGRLIAVSLAERGPPAALARAR